MIYIFLQFRSGTLYLLEVNIRLNCNVVLALIYIYMYFSLWVLQTIPCGVPCQLVFLFFIYLFIYSSIKFKWFFSNFWSRIFSGIHVLSYLLTNFFSILIQHWCFCFTKKNFLAVFSFRNIGWLIKWMSVF